MGVVLVCDEGGLSVEVGRIVREVEAGAGEFEAADRMFLAVQVLVIPRIDSKAARAYDHVRATSSPVGFVSWWWPQSLWEQRSRARVAALLAWLGQRRIFGDASRVGID